MCAAADVKPGRLFHFCTVFAAVRIFAAMEIQLKEITPNESNPRFIRDDAFQKLKRSVAQFPAMLQKRGLAVRKQGKKWETIGGNMRFRALTDLQAEISDPEKFKKTYKVKEKEIQVLESYFTGGIPCIDCSEFTDKEVQRFVIADNVPFGEWDTEVLANEWSADDLADWGLDIEFAKPEPEAFEDDYQIPNEIETDIVLGDLFEIGPHRLLCGDSTKVEDVERLMNGAKADLLLTDPPYGLNDKMKGGTWGINAIYKEMLVWDKVIKLEHIEYLKKIADDSIIWGANYYDTPASRCWLSWNKTQKMDTLADFELAWTSFDRLAKSYDEARNPDGKRAHPTQKPVSLICWCIEFSDKAKKKNTNFILDPFLGSGTTMVAAHQLNRVCYGMELDPKYCQVIVDRMLKLDPALQVKKNGQPYQSLVIHS